MSTQELAYIGVGANLGDRVQTIIDARNQLAGFQFCDTLRSASLYLSSPVGYDAQPAFINTVFELRLNAQARELFDCMRKIETSLGRQRDPSNQNAPRAIDLDLLLFGDEQHHSPELMVPHPRLMERRFVLEPLLELDPHLMLNGQPLIQTYQLGLRNKSYQGQEIFRLGGQCLSDSLSN